MGIDDLYKNYAQDHDGDTSDSDNETQSSDASNASYSSYKSSSSREFAFLLRFARPPSLHFSFFFLSHILFISFFLSVRSFNPSFYSWCLLPALLAAVCLYLLSTATHRAE